MATYIRKPKKEVPFVLTAEEVDTITKNLKDHSCKKRKKNTIAEISVDSFFRNELIGEFINRIIRLRDDSANKISVPPDTIKIRFTKGYYSHVSLFYDEFESDEDFNKRIEESLKAKLRIENEEKVKRLAEEEKQRAKNKKIVMKAIEEMGMEIYDIFNEINKNKHENKNKK